MNAESGTMSTPAIDVRGITKTYGPTQALSGVTLTVEPGEIRGVVGHNGAGKSTLMRILSGVEKPTRGELLVNGRTSPGREGFAGVRMAFQETSLAAELTVAQNAYLSSRRLFSPIAWRAQARQAITQRLDEIFPGHPIGPDDYVSDLTLTGRQMVEIARATLSSDLSVLILDEPTESLTGNAIESLYAYVRRIAERGVSVVLISHRLGEVLGVSDTVTVLRDGADVSTHRAAELTEDDLFVAMGGEATEPASSQAAQVRSISAERSVRAPIEQLVGGETELLVHKGEIVGLAGIAGQGQEEVLERIWRRKAGVDVDGSLAYVPGDRQRLGIFPLWSVAENLSISAIASRARFGVRNGRHERALVGDWVSALKIRGGAQAKMTGLSGGNQQKVIVARAFASDAEIILLNDPFRGVDVQTKQELYALLRREADRGRSIVWYSSENSEMQHCDRAYVLRAGKVAGELHGDDIDDSAIISLSFVAQKEAS